MRLVVALFAALLLAGCTAPQELRFQRGEEAPEPYYKEYREPLAGEHHKTFIVPVAEGARHLQLGVALESRREGLPLPGVAPASLRVVLVGPDGIVVDEGRLEFGGEPLVLDVPGPLAGAHEVRVDGFGASQDVEGGSYGAGYRLTAEVVYGA